MLPLVCDKLDFRKGDYIYIENVRKLITDGAKSLPAKQISRGKVKDIELGIGELTEEEKKIILSGCLINYNKNRK